MSRALEHDDLLDEEPPQRDLVLRTPALLGIFFTLAIVCAVCFGWGYSSAHGWRKTAADPAASTTAAASVPAPGRRAFAHPVPLGGSVATAETQDDASSGMDSTKPLPGAGATTMATGDASQDAVPASPARAPVATAEPEAAGFPPNYVAPTYTAPPAARPAPSAAPERAGIQAEGTSLMVQIAAVSRAADAQTLASALRHDGFAAMVRTSTTDNYFHIQVGPFATLEAAKAMRTRLVDTGYNAFIKP